MERWEIELDKKEREDKNYQIALDSYIHCAIEQIEDCLRDNDGDLCDTLNSIYLDADDQFDIELSKKQLK